MMVIMIMMAIIREKILRPNMRRTTLGDGPDDIAEPEVSFHDDEAEQEGVIHKLSWS